MIYMIDAKNIKLLFCMKRKSKKPEVAKIHHDGILWPRFIAREYRNGKTLDWVKQQCLKYENPKQVYQWVRHYVTGE